MLNLLMQASRKMATVYHMACAKVCRTGFSLLIETACFKCQVWRFTTVPFLIMTQVGHLVLAITPLTKDSPSNNSMREYLEFNPLFTQHHFVIIIIFNKPFTTFT